MEYTIAQLARLAGVSTRTLRYYHQIGLLSPARVTKAGYRVYTCREVDRLQQILFYRELEFPLEEIGTLLSSPEFCRLQVLRGQLSALEERRQRLELLIRTMSRTIQAEEGEIVMRDPEKFEGFKQEQLEENQRIYGPELQQRYGSQAVEECSAKRMSLTQEEYRQMTRLEEQLRLRLEQAVRQNAWPTGEQGLDIARMHRRWLAYSWPRYSPQAHAGLAEMYLADRRFTAYYDRAVEGCAQFLRDAIVSHQRELAQA